MSYWVNNLNLKSCPIFTILSFSQLASLPCNFAENLKLQLMKNLNPVCWFDIHVSNLEKSKKFYEAVLNIQLTNLPPEWGKQATFPFQENGANSTGALVETENLTPSGNNTVIYFASEDCLTEQVRVEKAGGKVIKPKMPIGEFGFISLFSDVDGNVIGLHSRK